jgi:two-component system NarL family sensor kinase
MFKNYLKICFTAVYFFLTICIADAQNQKSLDSLENILKKSSNDQIKLKLAGDLCWSYSGLNFEKALNYGKTELKLAEKLKDSASVALANSDIGNCFTRVNNLKSALEYHLKAYVLREKLGLKQKAAGSISNIAVIYKQLGNYKDALDYMHRSLKIYEESGDEPKQALVLGNIGDAYLDYSKLDAAKESFESAIILAKKHNSNSSLANSYYGLTQYYFLKKEYTLALKYGRIAEKYLKLLNIQSDLVTLYNTYGQIYFETGNYKLAMWYYNQSLPFREFMKDKLGIASCYKNIGYCYFKINDDKKAEVYLNKSIVLFKELNSKDYLREAYKLLGDIYEKKQDYIKSLQYFKASASVKDSIYNKQQSDKINELQITYQTNKKIQQITLLNKENKIQKLLLFKRNLFLAIALATIFITLLVSYLLYNRSKLKQETRLQLEIIKQQDFSTKAVLDAEEKERKRIAGDLHDGVGQLFSVVRMNLSGLLERAKLGNESDKILAEKTLALVDESCKEVRSISHQMMPNVLLKSGLADAIKNFIDKIDKETLKIHLQTFGLKNRLESNVETVLYRVIQETVNNVIKHAEATELDIQLVKEDESITATIEDNGKGFNTLQLKGLEGLGLKNIRTRVEYLKGTVDFDSSIGRGTVVSVWIPLI